jgi:hypothetical protein
MRPPKRWWKTFLLSLALMIVTIPAWAQQGGMGVMGDRSTGQPRTANPPGMGTMAPGSRPSAGSMGGSNGMSSMPATRPLGVAGLGVRSGMSGSAGASGMGGVSSLGNRPGMGGQSGVSALGGRVGISSGAPAASSTGGMSGMPGR